ncbi:MAG: L,D-transpeptidase family protein [Algoriphagus sp.]|uniref:L,D-transpeptidase family protein n=2 Tax=Algoriphagus sp. TaxID=1872435 RepID=UPI002720AACD|nr:L,D-transpeptidase family protein [Algoriphagus sp.]MDO8966207.1 L,D-transpeptidase family protein [Algoriphagus sp.]MDP3198645.1 L,D-transpeptidase family protein [Algoriphagus sp.]
MMIRKITFILFLGFSPLFLLASTHGDQDPLQDQIRLKLESIQPGRSLSIRNQNLSASGDIFSFYSNREFREIWSSDGILTELAYELRFEIRQSKFDGLDPQEYHLGLIDTFFNTFEANKKNKVSNDLGELVDLELLLSDAFFQLAAHLERGKVNPALLKSTWEIARKPQKVNYGDLLSVSLASGEIRRNLETIYPKFTSYKRGREVIRQLDEKSKVDSLNWKPIKIDKTIKVGESNNSIPVIRQRLQFWGYMGHYETENPKVYDSLLFEGVKEFQRKNGMEPDGALGKNSIAGINNSPNVLLDRAAVNMERLRWLPDTLKEAEIILVNIANYRLDYIYKLDTLFSSKVIVGKQYHATPIFSAAMSYIVFSPYWNIPNSIARNEIIPAIRKNPDYLRQKNMEVVTFSGQPVDPSTINWSNKSFPYMIRQRPGGSNSLGLVKFMFPNRFSVYIHDTPTRALFDREDRALSHGCIRLQNPTEFAKILLSDMPEWTDERINQAMNQKSERIVNLNRKIPVALVYLTFWADSKGQAHFRQDIYNRDAEILTLLRK